MYSHFNHSNLNIDDEERALIENIKNFPQLNYINSYLDKGDSSLIVFKLMLLYFCNVKLIDLSPVEFIDFNDYIASVKMITDWSKGQEWKNKLILIPTDDKVLITTYRYWHLCSLCHTFKRTFSENGISKVSKDIYISSMKPMIFDYCDNPRRFELYANRTGRPTFVVHTFFAQTNYTKLEKFIKYIESVFSLIDNATVGISESIQVLYNERKAWKEEKRYGHDKIQGTPVIELDSEIVGIFRKTNFRETGIRVYPYINKTKYLKI